MFIIIFLFFSCGVRLVSGFYDVGLLGKQLAVNALYVLPLNPEGLVLTIAIGLTLPMAG